MNFDCCTNWLPALALDNQAEWFKEFESCIGKQEVEKRS